MDNKLLGLIGIGVAAYILLKKKEDETIAIISNDSTPKDPIIEPVIITNTEVIGCMDPQAQDYNPLATIPNTDANGNQMCTYDPTPVPPVLGCVDGVAENYNPLATADDGSCNYPIEQVIGCMDQNSITYNPLATVETQDGLDEYGYPLCQYGDPIDPITFGCTDPTATNYDLNASDDDGTCAYPVYGCPNPLSDNYDPLANVDDGSCIGPFNVLPSLIPGCMDANANNYSPIAQYDDGSCQYPPAQVIGCTDPLAENFNPSATIGCSNTSPILTPYLGGNTPVTGGNTPVSGGNTPATSSGGLSSGFNGGQFMFGNY